MTQEIVAALVEQAPTADSHYRTTSTLAEVMEYSNDDVIDSFLRAFSVDRAEATALFDELKKWLWLNVEIKRHPSFAQARLAIDDPILIIDEMWHTFILHTKDYAEFSERMFGRFQHHKPTTRRDIEGFKCELAQVPVEDRTNWLRDRKRPQYKAVHELLGQATFVKWYVDFPQKYSGPVIKNLRKK